MRKHPPNQTAHVVHELQERESCAAFFDDVALFAERRLADAWVEKRITRLMNATGQTEEQVRLNWRWRVNAKPVLVR